MKKRKRKTIRINIKELDLYSLSELRKAIYNTSLSKYKLKKSYTSTVLEYIRKEEPEMKKFSDDILTSPLFFLAVQQLIYENKLSRRKIGNITIHIIKPTDTVNILEKMSDTINTAELKEMLEPLNEYLEQARNDYKNSDNMIRLKGMKKRRNKPTKSNRRIFPDEEE